MTFKELRVRSGLTANEVANKLNISESAYRKYEISNRVPRSNKLRKLQKIFKCTDKEIMEALEFHSKEWGKND